MFKYSYYKMQRHIYKHIVKYWYNIHRKAQSTHYHMAHLWELIFVWFLWCMSLIMASSSNLPNNNSFSYPLKQVSTLECRTLYRNEMPESCKINLPRIYWWNYSAYKENELYRSIYTVLWAAPYSDSWNQKIWAHAGIDVATARGTPLYSIWDWEVYSAWWNSAYWNLVRIKYVYNWEIVYGVYAHMDTISVKVWDKIAKWQRIGTVWNTWNTSWWLGWYHVHFEIAKDSFGRPAYAYTNCPDLSKWHYSIIQNGLCRTELISYQYDPIRLLEAWSTYVPLEQATGTNSLTGSTNNTINLSWVISSGTSNNQIDKDNINNESNNNIDNNLSGNNWNWSIDNNLNNSTNTEEEHTSPTIKTWDNSNTSWNNSNTSWNNNIVVDDKDTQDTTVIDETKKDPLLIELNFNWLKDMWEHFARIWDVEIRSALKQRNLLLWETVTLDIEIFKKWKQWSKEGNYYNWILQTPFMFLLNNDFVSANISSLQLITKWKAKIQITWNKVGKSSLVIKLDDKKIWTLDIVVQ